MSRTLALMAVAAAILGGCLLDIDFDGTSFTCEDGKCPDGFSCVQSMCVAESAGEDGGPGRDAAAGDAAPPDGGGGATCDDQYGEAGSYVLCLEEADSCEFFVRTEVATACADICPLYGGECINSFDSDGSGTECTRLEEGACTAVHQGQICICSRS